MSVAKGICQVNLSHIIVDTSFLHHTFIKMNIPFSLFFLAFAIQRAAAKPSVLEQHGKKN